MFKEQYFILKRKKNAVPNLKTDFKFFYFGKKFICCKKSKENPRWDSNPQPYD